MHIDWWTLALQAINFLILVWLLWRFLYRPAREVIEKRRMLAEQAFAEADAKKDEAETARESFEQQRAGLADERQAMLKKIHADLEAERAKVLDAARRDAEALVDKARKALAEERAAAVKEMRAQAASLAADLAADLLRKTRGGAADGAFLAQLEDRLKAMPADELARLTGDLAPEDARLTVVTAAPLTSDQQDQWSRRIADCLGPGTLKDGKADFASDPEILGGAELHFPHAVLKFTWADQLRKAEELLQSNDHAS